MPCSICRMIGHNRRTCRSIPLTKTNICHSSRGKKCLQNGISYEQKILLKLSMISYKNYPIQIQHKSGGATMNADIQLQVGDILIQIEAKNKGAFEGGGKTMKLHNGRLSCPNGSIHSIILDGYTPWSGRIPSFLKGDKSLRTWNCEKFFFRDEYRRIAPDVISQYYYKKNIHYIQVEGKGLYHTGNDILQLGVPLFECRARLRIRCKQHSSSSMPSSVQASFTFDRRSLDTSPYDIESNLPDFFVSSL